MKKIRKAVKQNYKDWCDGKINCLEFIKRLEIISPYAFNVAVGSVVEGVVGGVVGGCIGGSTVLWAAEAVACTEAIAGA